MKTLKMKEITERILEVKKMINSAEEYSEYALGDSHSALSDIIMSILNKMMNDEPIDELFDELYEPAFSAYADVLEELKENIENYSNELEKAFVDTSELRVSLDEVKHAWSQAMKSFYDEKNTQKLSPSLKNKLKNYTGFIEDGKLKKVS